MSEREPMGAVEGEGDNNDAAIESQARELGWVPEAEFKGDKSRWKSAGDFVEYASGMVPILRKNNQQLSDKLAARDREFVALQQRVAEQDRILKTLDETVTNDAAASLESRIDQTRSAISEAMKAQEFETAAELTEALTDMKAELKDLKKKKDDPPPRAANSGNPYDDPVFRSWIADNEWTSDPAMLAAANVIGGQIINEHKERGQQPPTGRALLDEVSKRVDNKFNVSRRPTGEKVGSDTGGTRTAGTGGKTFASLPAEAKQVCLNEAKRRVGEGKAYPTLEAWQKRYAEVYYAQVGA